MPTVTRDYIDASVRTDAALLDVVSALRVPPGYAGAYGKVLLPRPIFADRDEITRFATDLTAVFELLTSLPRRCFGGDLGRYCAALGMDERLSRLLRLDATGAPAMYARADAFHDGESFRLLEFNVGSELGGVDAPELNRAFLEVEAFTGFADGHGLEFVDTAALLGAELRRSAREITARDPVVALIEGRGGLAEHRPVFVAIQEAVRRHGVDLLLGEPQELTTTRDGKLALRGSPLDVVLRYFSAGELLDDPTGSDSLAAIMRAHQAGATVLFTPLEGALFASKGSLGLLHDPELRQAFTAAEREVVDRVVPWTRVLSGSDRAVADDRAELVDRCREHRAALVLKPGVGYGGEGVVIGADCSEQAWSDALVAVADSDFAVQELLVPAPEPVVDPVTGALEDWRANWGVFVTSEGYGGAFVRALQARDGSVISYSNPGTRGTCVFTAGAGDLHASEGVKP